MTYAIEFTRSAMKAIAALQKSVRAQVTDAIEGLAAEPRPDGVKKLKDVVPPTYRIRVGDYRILYTISDTKLTVTIEKVGPRDKAYK